MPRDARRDSLRARRQARARFGLRRVVSPPRARAVATHWPKAAVLAVW